MGSNVTLPCFCAVGPSHFLNGLLCTPVNSHPGSHPSTFCFLMRGQALLSCGAVFFCLLSSLSLCYHPHLPAALSPRGEQSPAPSLPAPDSSGSSRAGPAGKDSSKEPVGRAVPSPSPRGTSEISWSRKHLNSTPCQIPSRCVRCSLAVDSDCSSANIRLHICGAQGTWKWILYNICCLFLVLPPCFLLSFPYISPFKFKKIKKLQVFLLIYWLLLNPPCTFSRFFVPAVW